ncbi:DUF2306 domain-containing protein [Parvicella tangerina]|uniref:DUF2306 domain-containing protein n=1 Tax=Parvicella tangerina TaxID=2829795 RepID=A0A916JNC3_9FLAO|nr:DUF2306 domain-containing protein [Parvicella tangerina]CAG5083666.1 hypothetical protein CRYO30217_02258 [Parvicella tangerina]
MSIGKIIISILGLSILAFLGYFMLLITLDYFPISEKVGFLRIKQWVFRKYPGAESTIWFTAFYIHVASSMFVLLAGFTQFFKIFYKNKIHRYMGVIYVLVTLVLSAPSGFYMGIYANGGIWSQVSFITLSILWWGTTFMGYRKARKKEYDIHRKWMIISYALALSALTLRAWKFGITNWTDLNMKPMDLYRLVAWIGWVPNFILALVIISVKNKSNITTIKYDHETSSNKTSSVY